MDEKANRRPSTGKVYYQISEVAQLTGVNESTLRNWEEQYEELRNVRRINNRRHYTVADIELIERINQKRLNKDSQNEAIQAVDTGHKHAEAASKEPNVEDQKTLPSEQVEELVKALREVRKELQAIASCLS